VRLGKIAIVLSTLVIGVFASCGDSDESASSAAPSPTVTSTLQAIPSPTFEQRRALIDTGDDSVLIDVEVASKPEQRGYGLMNRETLAEDAGMVFLWFGPTSGAFYMKDTLIPLSIAFFDERGRILKILDMDPCKQEPCRLYDPGVVYWGALEVNQGAFERWGVERGDTITVPS
jgi:uncharacterized membrane protein (UPF0127 family)